MLDTVNVAQLFQKGSLYKIDAKEEAQLVGGARKPTPRLPQDEMIGVIKNVTSNESNTYIQLLIEFEYNNKVCSLKKNLYWDSRSDSEYISTLTMLLDSDSYQFDPDKPFNKYLLVGKVVSAELGHKKYEGGFISDVTKIICEIKPVIEHMDV